MSLSPRLSSSLAPMVRTVAAGLPALLLGSTLLGGCGTGGAPTTQVTQPLTRFAVQGSLHGGQQAIVGGTIQLYAAGHTGTASAARAMLTAPVITGADGSFNITNLYACQPGDEVYIVGTGGDAGSGPNPAIALMAALGSCATLKANAATTFINITEVTTVGAVYALAPYMTGLQNVGADYTSTPATNALAAAFATVNTMVDNSVGQSFPTSTGQGVVPQATINSLANSLAACVNSTGSNSTSCTSLFSDTTVTGSTPATTLQAALNLAHYPTTNPAAVYNLASAAPPFQPTLTSAPASYAIAVAHPSDVLLYHNNAARTGVQSAETILTPTNISSTTFGKLYSFPVDSYLFAQPLYVGGIGMPDGTVHNLVIAATTHATVYAFDADGNNPNGSLWSESLLPSGDRYPIPSDYNNCGNPVEAGIVGTPVIDRNAQTIYLIVKSVNSTTGVTTQKFHAISLIDGSERSGSPVVVSPTFSGTGDGAAGGVLTFSAQRQLNRSALLIAPNASGGNTIWVAYASHCDIGPYHGIVLGYDGATLANTATYISTPNGGEGGIWMSNGGLAADSAGYIYGLVGNGTFDANTNSGDYGDSAIKLAPPAAGSNTTQMSLVDYFTPTNQATLSSRDLDLGGSQGILLTDSASGVAPHLYIGNDKNGSVYLINTDNMMRYDTGPGNTNGDIQDFSAGGVFINNFSFFNNYLYTSTPIHSIQFHPGTLTTTGYFDTGATATANFTAAPVISANGITNGIMWVGDTSSVLHAYTTPNLVELYNSGQAANNRDAAPPYVKFTSPIIANGKVFLSGQGAISVYGPLQ